MADQKINELPTKTAPSTGDKMLMIGAAEEYQIDYNQLAKAILNQLTSQTFTLDQGTKTLIAALNELNSNKIGKGQNTISSLNAIKESGTYCGSNLWGDAVWTTNFAVIQVDGAGFIIGFNTSDSVHSRLNTIYYAIRSSGKEWVTKIDNL